MALLKGGSLDEFGIRVCQLQITVPIVRHFSKLTSNAQTAFQFIKLALLSERLVIKYTLTIFILIALISNLQLQCFHFSII